MRTNPLLARQQMNCVKMYEFHFFIPHDTDYKHNKELTTGSLPNIFRAEQWLFRDNVQTQFCSIQTSSYILPRPKKSGQKKMTSSGENFAHNNSGIMEARNTHSSVIGPCKNTSNQRSASKESPIVLGVCNRNQLEIMSNLSKSKNLPSFEKTGTSIVLRGSVERVHLALTTQPSARNLW